MVVKQLEISMASFKITAINNFDASYFSYVMIIGHCQYKVMHHYIQDSSILTLSYPGSGVDQLWSRMEDIAIITIILSPGCQQPFLIKTASDNQLSAAVFGTKWLVTASCQQPLPSNNLLKQNA